MKKMKKKGGGVLLRISNSRSRTFQAWTERSPYNESEIAIIAQLMGSGVLMDSSWHSGRLMVPTQGRGFFYVFFRNAL